MQIRLVVRIYKGYGGKERKVEREHHPNQPNANSAIVPLTLLYQPAQVLNVPCHVWTTLSGLQAMQKRYLYWYDYPNIAHQS